MSKRPQNTLIGQIPPHSLEDEATVLGYILTVKDPLASLQDHYLSDNDFYDELHKKIYRQLYEQFRNARRANAVELHQKLSNDKILSDRGGKSYFATLRTYHQGQRRAKEAAQAVKELSRRRGLINGCTQALTQSFDLSVDFDEIQRELHSSLSDVSRAISNQNKPETAYQLAHYYFDQLEAMSQKKDMVGVASPFPDLDKYTCGFAPGEVVICAGRPGTGKTALALNIATHIVKQGHCTGVFSLEMTSELLLNRIFSSQAGVSAQKFRRAQFSREDWSALHNFADEFRQLPYVFSDQANLKPSQFRDKCRAWKSEHDLKFVVIDYLQLMQPERSHTNREREIAEVSRTIKTTAVELGVPILILAQLNREAERTKKPLLSQLRESGALEQDADMVLFIAPWKNDPEQSNIIVDIDVAKGRNNAVGSFKLIYQKSLVRFLSYQGDG